MSMQMLQQQYPTVFAPGSTRFERAIIEGGSQGLGIIAAETPLRSDAEAVRAVAAQIQLLRDVRKFGLNEYYAYRMGALAALTSKLMMPYGFAYSAGEERVQSEVLEDIEAHLESYRFTPRKKHREYIRDVRGYFDKNRKFFEEDRQMIGQDYLSSAGYGGFLKNGAAHYFSRSVEAVADVWHTALRHEALKTEVPVSARVLKQYFTSEIVFFLERQNYDSAVASYEHFALVNYESAEAYRHLGDVFYHFGTDESMARGIREWIKAYDMGGTDRGQVAQRLVAHYTGQGRVVLAKDRYNDEDLPNALTALETALSYDNTNEQAAQLIQETKKKSKLREEHLLLMQELLARGNQLKEQGDALFQVQNQYGDAIATLKQAKSVLEAVDAVFEDLERDASKLISECKKSVTKVINSVIDEASDEIDAGDQASQQGDFAGAVQSYGNVEVILASISADESPDVLEDCVNLKDMAEERIKDAKVRQAQYETARREHEVAGGS